MASFKGKAGDRAEKKQIRKLRPDNRSRVKTTHRVKRADTPYRRQSYQSVSIPQLVYELLTIDKHNKDVKKKSPESYKVLRGMPGYHERRQLPYEAVDPCDSSESIEVSEYGTESRCTSIGSLTEMMDAANSSTRASSANSSVSNVSVKPIALANSLNNIGALFKKKSLMQVINNYIKAGIEEGKRQAKKYICKALSFGVKSGYLIPANRQGNMLRVCPTLTSSRGTDVESRLKRRIARRGETRLTTIDDRKAMRRGITRIRSRNNISANTAISKRRYRGFHIQSPVRSLSPREGSSRKSPSREKNRVKIDAKEKRTNNKVNVKRTQKRRKTDIESIRKPVKRHRTALSPKRNENDHEYITESSRNANNRDHDKSKNNEDNRSVIIERRKSTSCRENYSKRMGKQKSVLNIDDNPDIEDINDNDEKSEETSYEYDVNGENIEIDA